MNRRSDDSEIRRTRWRLLAGIACAIAVLFSWAYVRAHNQATGVGQFILTYAGKVDEPGVDRSIAELVEAPINMFRLTIKPASGRRIAVRYLSILPSDRMGRYVGGDEWDTYSPYKGPLVVAHRGKVLNGGPKGALNIRVDEPTTLDLRIDGNPVELGWSYATVMIGFDGEVIQSNAARIPTGNGLPISIQALSGEQFAITYLGREKASGLQTDVKTARQSGMGFHLTVRPRNGQTIILRAVSIVSTDRAGLTTGGARWDTYSAWARGVSIVRNGLVLNAGPKRPLSIPFGDPAEFDLLVSGGDTMGFWPYFRVTLSSASGFAQSRVVSASARGIGSTDKRLSEYASKFRVVFVGKTDTDVVRTSTSVAPDGRPDAAFDLVVTPQRGEMLRIRTVTITSTDSTGRPAGGAAWDTFSSVQALGIVRNGDILNPGQKRILDLNVTEPAVLRLYIHDGGLTAKWPYFVVAVSLDGGDEYAAIVKTR